MGIITKEVEIRASKGAKRYKNLGYDVPTKKITYRSGHLSLDDGTVFDKSKKFMVKIEDLPRYSKVPITVQCDLCEDIYTVRKSNLLNYTSYNESGLIVCKKCSESKYFIGNKHPRWNENKTDEERQNSRTYVEYQKMVKSVMDRDEYKCILCNSKKDIVVHHLNAYAKFIEQRTDTQNCITLCSNCHKNFHFEYGYGENTKEQFEEWINKTIELKKGNDIELQIAKEIYCYETNRFYSSTKECAKELGLKCHKTIMNVCTHRRNASSYKGFHFIFGDIARKMSNDEIIDFIIKDTSDNRLNKFIDLETGIIYFSAQQCMRETNFSKHYNLTDLNYSYQNIMDNHYRLLPYEKFIALSECDKNKLLKTKNIKLFNKLERAGGL